MIGLDVGTSFIVASSYNGDKIEFNDFRDAFYVIKPTTPIATKMVEKGLKGKIFIKDTDGSFGGGNYFIKSLKILYQSLLKSLNYLTLMLLDTMTEMI